MKPTELQKEVIDLCISELNFWKNTNDITSPTHSCDIDEEINKLVCEDKITEIQAARISGGLHSLWHTIRCMTIVE